ncbi:heavy metal translocating P-type ATPase [Gordonibacter pamelaeae]
MTRPVWKKRLDGALHAFEDKVLGAGGMKRDAAFLVVSALSILLSFAAPGVLPFDWAWIAIVLCGVPIVLEAVVALVTEFDVKADVLVSLALVASIVIGEYDAAGIVAFIMQVGGFLEEATVKRARAGIERLVALTPRTARIVEGGRERTVDAREVPAGALLRVLPGETIPVDGVIVAGSTSVDTSIMTGESLPVDMTVGDEVESGFANQFGSIDVRATRVGEDSSLARMVRLVQSADAGKAKIVRTADAWATWIVVAALSASIACYLFTGEAIRAVTVLVVFCPCALVLATPTAIMAAIGNATKHGFLTREGDALERLAKVTHVAFDKTGTLTQGRPRVVEVVAASEAGGGVAAALASATPGGGAVSGAPEAAVFAPASGASPRERVFELAARAERRSEHPLGKALTAGFAEEFGRAAAPAEEFELKLGRGVAARVGGVAVLVGNGQMMREAGVDVPPACQDGAQAHAEQGHTAVFVAADGVLQGYVALADTVRGDSAAAVADLKAAGAKPVLLTGDNERAARSIAAQLGIDEVRANCLPADKMAYVESVEEGGGRVCMVGDGVNDAPALRRSFVGIAMGGVGSDIAVDASDIALVNDSLGELGHVLGLARHTLRTIKVNLTFAMGVNIVATLLAMAGVLGPVAGALVHNVGSVIVIGNSALLLGWRARRRDRRRCRSNAAETPHSPSARAAGSDAAVPARSR